MDRKDMTFSEHISELRKRLIFILVFFFLAFVAGFFLAEPIILYLSSTKEAASFNLNVFRVTDPIKIYFEMAFILACVFTSPMVLYQIWAFVAPGLYEKERRVTLSYIPISIVLFLAGVAFSYFIMFPFVLLFMTNLSEKLEVTQVIGMNEYFRFLYELTIPFGLLFQLPVIILFLTRLGIITPQFLSRVRKYAYFGLLVTAAVITPPDVLSLIMVTLPLFLLYEISIWISKIAFRKKEAEEKNYEEGIDSVH